MLVYAVQAGCSIQLDTTRAIFGHDIYALSGPHQYTCDKPVQGMWWMCSTALAFPEFGCVGALNRCSAQEVVVMCVAQSMLGGVGLGKYACMHMAGISGESAQKPLLLCLC